MENNTLPRVVEFGHQHTVKVITDGTTTRIIATPNVKWAPKYKRASELPFAGTGADNRLYWWYFPKAANYSEAQTRGEFFWNEFVRFARGPQKRRAEDAEWALDWIIEAMPKWADGATEATVFRKKLAEALVAHLRVGVEP